jgi:DNA-binding NarL/FixJ family response regulator/anti-sigma regulatory factor (Ser/Thr protein kinase)
VRKYILGIRTAEHQPPVDFIAELEQFLDTQRQQYGLETQVSLPDDWLDSPFSQDVEIQLLRVIQEALTNVRKHAGVDKARLLFTQHANEVQVVIEDDGVGFEVVQPAGEATKSDKGHFGLTIMRERAESVGGRLEVRSGPGEGTCIILRLPRAIVPAPGEELARGVRVLLVDDHPMYLEGLRSLLAARGILVVGQAHDGLEALEKARTLRPDLILMDVQMPRCDGVEATRRIKAELPEVRIIMLTMAADSDTLFEAIRSGASGYLLKSLEREEFFSLLGRVIEGETALSPGLAARTLAEFARADAQPPAEETLTARQREVLELAAQGLTNREIAGMLTISAHTVKYHISQILERLQLQSRHELGRYTQQEGKE